MSDAPFWLYPLRTLIDNRDTARKMAALLGTPIDAKRDAMPEGLMATYEDDEIAEALDAMSGDPSDPVYAALAEEMKRRSI